MFYAGNFMAADSCSLGDQVKTILRGHHKQVQIQQEQHFPSCGLN